MILTQAAAQNSNGFVVILVLSLLVVGGYVASLYLHPLTHCRRCKGSPRSYGSIYTKSWRNCGKCNGSGREVRRGARMLGIEP